MSDFQKSKKIGEKIEKSKIAYQDFKLCPWATQSPNMSFLLPLGSKIIAAEIWSPDFWGCRGFWTIFNGIPIENGPEPSTSKKISTSNLRSYNLRPQRELEAYIRWLCSPGPLFKILGTDFCFFDFFAEIFWFLKIWYPKIPKISDLHWFSEQTFLSNHPKKRTSDFSESRTTPDPTVVWYSL